MCNDAAEVRVVAWSGGSRPWRAEVRWTCTVCGGLALVCSGGCTTQGRAKAAGTVLAAKAELCGWCKRQALAK